MARTPKQPRSPPCRLLALQQLEITVVPSTAALEKIIRRIAYRAVAVTAVLNGKVVNVF